MFSDALIGALIATAFPALAQIFSPDSWRRAVPWILGGFVGNLLLNWIIVYSFYPGMTGPLGGFHYLWITIALNMIIAFMISMSDTDDNPHHVMAASGSLVALVLMMLVWIFVGIGVNWGDGNAKIKANYMQLTVAVDNPETEIDESLMPESDTAHMLMVDEPMARYIGSKVIPANYGSMYQPGKYTVMSVQKHLYWAAPLIYNNVFANWKYPTVPGFIVVDGEDPSGEGTAWFVAAEMHCIPGAWMGQDVTRHAYLSGYSDYRLMDTTFELDDNWKPYFTIDTSTYFRGFTGTKVDGILVIDPTTSGCATIPYSLEAMPAWVDRAIPVGAANQYVDWYGKWANAPWWNPSGANQQMYADDVTAMAYNGVEEYPVYQYVMTSTSLADASSTGVILFDTRANKATLYPIQGMGVGSDVVEAFVAAPANIKNYTISQIILANFYGQLTWSGVYTSVSGNTATYAAYGVLNAKAVQASNVIMTESKEEALRSYRQWLSNRGSNSVDPTGASTERTIEGYVERIGTDLDKESGTMFYILMIRDMDGNLIADRFFYASSLLNDKLPLTVVGDHVVIKYLDTQERMIPMVDFNNLNPAFGGSTDLIFTPTMTPSPTPLPTFTPTVPSPFENTPPSP